MKKEMGVAVLLVVLCAIVAILNPRFLGTANLHNMARLIGMFGIFSIGSGLVIITGGIDLSIGSMFALQGVLLAIMLRQWHWFWAAAVLAIIVGTMGLGSIHGFLITKARLQPFIVTLCGLLFYRGLARYIANDETKGFGSEQFGPLRTLATGEVFSVPMPFIALLVIAVVMWIVLHRSVYGRYLFAVGHNEEAARYAGINSRTIVASAYIVAGALTGVAGILLAFYTNSISPSTHGSFYELYGIAAAVLGGCSLRGGEGSILGIVIGTALLQVLQNLVNLLGIPSSLNFAVMGAVILIGVLADELLASRRRSRQMNIVANR
ncbi:MAG TPA: ABC transporter permease [Verrucomicrobiae bacterium]|nr:ABC transporter permease [Verrucomicrobiae bacterium]